MHVRQDVLFGQELQPVRHALQANVRVSRYVAVAQGTLHFLSDYKVYPDLQVVHTLRSVQALHPSGHTTQA